jgi:hypothetical protein
MNELESELARHLAEPGDAGDTGLAERVRSDLERRIQAQRNLAQAGAGGALVAALLAALLVWKLGAAALTGWDTSHGTGVLLLLPFVAVVVLVGLAACAVARVILRPRRW